MTLRLFVVSQGQIGISSQVLKVPVCVRVYMCVCARVHMCIYVYICTLTHTHIHTDMHTRAQSHAHTRTHTHREKGGQGGGVPLVLQFHDSIAGS